MTAEKAKPPTPRQAGQLRVLIVEDDTLVGLGVRAHLERLEHTVVGQAANEAEALELFRTHQPDLVIADIRLNNNSSGGTEGIDLAEKLQAEKPCPVIILSAYSDDELIRRAAGAGVFGYLIKPATREALAAQIAVAMQRFSDESRMRDEKAELSQALETRKLLDRAKGILMKRLHLSEPDAHRKLQVESQKRRISMAEIAKKVIESESLLGG
jgi:response regulator NasT